MSGTIPSTLVDFRPRPMFSEAHQGAETGPAPDRAAGSGGVSRAERLVRPEVATHYVEAGDRLGGAMIGIHKMFRTILAHVLQRGSARRRSI